MYMYIKVHADDKSKQIGWDDLLYVFGPNPYVLQYAVYYTYYVYIYFIHLLMNISLSDETCDVCMMPLLTPFFICHLALVFLPSYSCGWIPLDPCWHDEHNYNIIVHRPLGFNIPSWMLM